jgi:hypothetical protein
LWLLALVLAGCRLPAPALPTPLAEPPPATATGVAQPTPTAEFALTPAPSLPPTSAATLPPASVELPSAPAALPPGFTPCGELLAARLAAPAEFQTDMFKHHAKGVFLILRLELRSLSAAPVMLWQGDYRLEGATAEKALTYPLHYEATNYLYLERPSHWFQDRLDPSAAWSSILAFDVDPLGKDWALVIEPGLQQGAALCQVRLGVF